MKKYISLLLFSLLMSLCFVCCAEDEKIPPDYYFVGDSIMRGWKVRDAFHNHRTYNCGVNGRTVHELEDFSIDNDSAYVICMVGTNDMPLIGNSPQERSAFVSKYLSIVSALGGERIFLFSVLPSKKNDRCINIPWFNDSVQSHLAEYPQVTYVDVYDQFADTDGLSIKPELTKDGLHLNTRGYRLLRSCLKDYLEDGKK